MLEGNDPAGYIVEAKVKAFKGQEGKGRGRGKKAKNPGGAFLRDGLPQSTRRTRQVETKKRFVSKRSRIQVDHCVVNEPSTLYPFV